MSLPIRLTWTYTWRSCPVGAGCRSCNSSYCCLAKFALEPLPLRMGLENLDDGVGMAVDMDGVARSKLFIALNQGSLGQAHTHSIQNGLSKCKSSFCWVEVAWTVALSDSQISVLPWRWVKCPWTCSAWTYVQPPLDLVMLKPAVHGCRTVVVCYCRDVGQAAECGGSLGCWGGLTGCGGFHLTGGFFPRSGRFGATTKTSNHIIHWFLLTRGRDIIAKAKKKYCFFIFLSNQQHLYLIRAVKSLGQQLTVREVPIGVSYEFELLDHLYHLVDHHFVDHQYHIHHLQISSHHFEWLLNNICF